MRPRHVAALLAGVSSLILGLPVAGIAKAHKPRCPKGKVHTSHGCKTPLTHSLITLRSASHHIAAQLAPNVDGDSEIAWSTAVAYPYPHACTGAPLTGVNAGTHNVNSVNFTTKSPYVGTSFSGSAVTAGGVQQVANGWQSLEVKVATHGFVTSLRSIKGTVTITETHSFGPTPSQQTVYATCGTTFSFMLTRYTGAFPGAAAP